MPLLDQGTLAATETILILAALYRPRHTVIVIWRVWRNLFEKVKRCRRPMFLKLRPLCFDRRGLPLKGFYCGSAI